MSKFLLLALGAAVAAFAFPPPGGRSVAPVQPEAPIEPRAGVVEARGGIERNGSSEQAGDAGPDQASKRAITAGRSAGAEPKR